MKALTFRIEQAPDVLAAGLEAVAQDHADRLSADGAVGVTFVVDSGLDAGRLEGQAGADGKSVTVRCGSANAAFRGLGRLLGCAGPEAMTFEEASSFGMRGLMIDCSRNGVMTVDALKAFMRRVALMGVNMIMLYTEDTYEVPGEPFFGYLRGRYTQDELRELDDYAHALGIEMIPCIQALAHMEQVLQWEAYRHLRDTNNVMLVGEEETYAFLRKIIRAACAPFRSKRIHLGMDEAHGLGSGRYKEINGERRAFDIMNEHLARVRDICNEEGLKPLIWSDMYFRLGSRDHQYYDMDWKIPADVVDRIPRDVQLVYWDYYHQDIETYRKMIEFHRQLGSEPVMAGGIWTWAHFWCALPWSLPTVETCMRGCREQGLSEVFMTMWGDDGMEVDIFSALPGIQHFCEHAFREQVDLDQVKRLFMASCGTSFDAWYRAADIDSVPNFSDPTKSQVNTSKGLLWQDPALAIYDPQVAGTDLAGHYRDLADDLFEAAGEDGLSSRLRFPAHIADVLSLKTDVRRRLHEACKAGDRNAAREVLEGDMARLMEAVDELWLSHRRMWMSTYKPFGWEVIECRYGGLRTRLATLSERVRDYVDGRLDALPEFEAELLDPRREGASAPQSVTHRTVKTPSCIK